MQHEVQKALGPAAAQILQLREEAKKLHARLPVLHPPHLGIQRSSKANIQRDPLPHLQGQASLDHRPGAGHVAQPHRLARRPRHNLASAHDPPPFRPFPQLTYRDTIRTIC